MSAKDTVLLQRAAVLQITDLEAGLVSSSDPAYSIFKGKKVCWYLNVGVHVLVGCLSHDSHVFPLQAIVGCYQAISVRWLVNFLIQSSLILL